MIVIEAQSGSVIPYTRFLEYKLDPEYGFFMDSCLRRNDTSGKVSIPGLCKYAACFRSL